MSFTDEELSESLVEYIKQCVDFMLEQIPTHLRPEIVLLARGRPDDAVAFIARGQVPRGASEAVELEYLQQLAQDLMAPAIIMTTEADTSFEIWDESLGRVTVHRAANTDDVLVSEKIETSADTKQSTGEGDATLH